MNILFSGERREREEGIFEGNKMQEEFEEEDEVEEEIPQEKVFIDNFDFEEKEDKEAEEDIQTKFGAKFKGIKK